MVVLVEDLRRGLNSRARTSLVFQQHWMPLTPWYADALQFPLRLPLEPREAAEGLCRGLEEVKDWRRVST